MANNGNPYHAFLIKHRIYCEHPCGFICMRKATTVRNFNGKDLVMCQEHASRLDAARKSESKQISVDKKPQTPSTHA